MEARIEVKAGAATISQHGPGDKPSRATQNHTKIHTQKETHPQETIEADFHYVIIRRSSKFLIYSPTCSIYTIVYRLIDSASTS